MKQYAICGDDLNQIQQQINNDDDNGNYDLIAPVTQDTEHQDEFEGTLDLNPDFNGTMTYLVI